MKYLKMKPIQYIVVGAIIAVIPFLFHIPQATMTILNTVVIYSMIALGFNLSLIHILLQVSVKYMRLLPSCEVKPDHGKYRRLILV